MRTKVLGYGKLVPLEADRDLEVDSKHQDKSRYRLSDTGMLLLKEETRRQMQMRRGRRRD
jgi:DNA-binding transcriptional regulator PaaX